LGAKSAIRFEDEWDELCLDVDVFRHNIWGLWVFVWVMVLSSSSMIGLSLGCCQEMEFGFEIRDLHFLPHRRGRESSSVGMGAVDIYGTSGVGHCNVDVSLAKDRMFQININFDPLSMSVDGSTMGSTK
jgi:hypothetical protein